MWVTIRGRDIKFTKVNLPSQTSECYLDDKQRYFLKKPIKFENMDVLKREIYILQKLQKYPFFPQLVTYSDDYLVTEYLGKPLTKQNVPKDALEQAKQILDALKLEEITHCDIKNEEVLVTDQNKIILVDFGWAKYKDTWHCGIDLCAETKPKYIDESDEKCLTNIIQTCL